MATSIDEIKGFLDEFDLKYNVHDEEPVIAIAFRLEPGDTAYRRRRGLRHGRRRAVGQQGLLNLRTELLPRCFLYIERRAACEAPATAGRMNPLKA